MKFVRINIDGTMNELSDIITMKNIRKVFESHSNHKGTKRILHIYSWSNNGNEIRCYGWCTGKAGNENKHDLPPKGTKHTETIDNSDTQLLFGNLFIVCKNKKLIDFDISDYGSFYSECFEGFDDCNTSDSDNEPYNEGSLKEFIVEDDSADELDQDYILDDDAELDEDENNY